MSLTTICEELYLFWTKIDSCDDWFSMAWCNTTQSTVNNIIDDLDFFSSWKQESGVKVSFHARDLNYSQDTVCSNLFIELVA